MATRQQFCDEMEKVYAGHGVYIGAANGELTESLTIGKIRELEESYYGRSQYHDDDICRDLTYIGNCYKKGWSMKGSYSGDCSGQIVGALRRLGVLSYNQDYSASMFQKAAKTVGLNDLRAGDLVFNKTSDASHVGVYVGDGYVIESQSRDTGTVKRKRTEGSWAIGGRLDWFEDDVMILTRILKYIPDNMMRGDDVKSVQEQLKLLGYNCGSADGVFGKKTKTAVQAFQLEHDLTADGIVGKNTALALGFAWEG